MGKEAEAHRLFDSACDFLGLAVDLAKEKEEDLSFLFDQGQNLDELEKFLEQTKKVKLRVDILLMHFYNDNNNYYKVHDHWLDRRGMKGRLYRTHQYPYDAKLRKKKKFRKAFKLEEPILSRERTERMQARMEADNEVYAEWNFKSEVQLDELCRGKQLRVS